MSKTVQPSCPPPLLKLCLPSFLGSSPLPTPVKSCPHCHHSPHAFLPRAPPRPTVTTLRVILQSADFPQPELLEGTRSILLSLHLRPSPSLRFVWGPRTA